MKLRPWAPQSLQPQIIEHVNTLFPEASEHAVKPMAAPVDEEEEAEVYAISDDEM